MWYIYINTLINLEHLKNYINLLFRRQYDIRKKSGFSLAEALITLLIVCLITLATVPVLTKKKRDTRNVSGMWMCSRKADGTYVYWSNIENSGDITNPETWQPTNTDSCTFVPSINAKNFVVTIIGGGGGGADGESSRKDYITNEQTSFTPAEDDEYNLFVVGGGGGATGECRPAQNAKYTYKPVEKERPVYDTNGNPVCEFQLTDAEGYFTSIVHPSYSYLHRCNNSQEVCIGYHITYSGGLISKNPIDYTNYINCTDKMAMLNKDTASIDDYRRVLEPCKTPSIYYKDYPKGMIVNNTTNNTMCIKEKTEKYTTQELVMTSPAKPAECDDSYNGASFGAGGGGGAASDTLGVFGKGGKGAYGAVIVEW